MQATLKKLLCSLALAWLFSRLPVVCLALAAVRPQPFYIQPADSSSMTLFVPKWRGTIQTNRMIPSMTRYAAATRSRRCPRESEPLACLKFESKQRVIFPLATVAMAYWEHAEYKLLL